MYNFTYHRAVGLDQAAELLGGGDDVKLLAGGQTLLPTMKQRLASPSDLVDLNGVEGMAGIASAADTLVIGAMCRHADVAVSPVVRKAIPALAQLAGMIGDPAVRHRGTIGGSIANNDPNADYPTACLGLGATIVTTRRRIDADAFFLGLFETALESDEIVREVSFPIPQKAGWQKFRNPASRFALVGVFVAQRGSEARVAVTGAGASGVFRVPAFEEALNGSFAPQVLEGLSISAEGLAGDIHGSAEYRAHLVGVLARRAVATANEAA